MRDEGAQVAANAARCGGAQGDWHVLRGGDAVVFARERDLAFARHLTL